MFVNQEQSLKNVNSFAFLALLAKLADRGWRLDRRSNFWRLKGWLEWDQNVIPDNQQGLPRRSVDSSAEQRFNVTTIDPPRRNWTGPKARPTAGLVAKRCLNNTETMVKGRIYSELKA